GIKRTLDDLSAAEIESFSVLKDAAASAVYGVRGANGVILVKTKRGQLGKPKVNFHLEQGFTKPTQLPDYIGSVDYLSLMDELYMDAGNPNPLYGEEMINNYRNNVDPELYPNVNWLDAVSKDMASNTRGDLTITGGSDILRYALVASYYGERGIFVRDESKDWDSSTRLNKYNIRSNVDINVTKTTVVGISIGGYLQEQNGMAVSGQDVWNHAFETPPFVHPIQYSEGRDVRVRERTNPWAEATQHGYQTTSSSKVESLFSVEQDLKFITPGLKFKGLFSFDRYSKSWVKRHRTPTYYNPATGRDEEGNLLLSVGTDGQEFLDTENKGEWGNKATYLEGNITYDRTFDGKHAVNGMFLYNQRDYQDGNVVPFRRMGIAGRASYTYDNRYIAEFNFGYNGSENFTKGNRFGFFPSVAVGYMLSEEKFMEKYKDTFSKIKFRASWGLTGNDQLDGRRFAFLPTIDTDGSYKWGVNNDYNRASRFEGEFGVMNLTWETVEKLNVGTEIGLWNALDLQVDWFKEQRRDIFMQRNNIPSAAGFRKTPWANYGKVDNIGVDLSLTYNQQITKDLHIGFRGTFTYAHNTIVEMDEALGVMGTNRQRTGHSVNELFGLVADGLFTEDDFVTNDKGDLVLKEGIPSHTFNSVRPGDIKYVDIDGDGSITNKDEVAMGGTVNPEIVYGFGATARYKQVDFNVFFQGDGKTHRFIGGVASNFLPGSSQGAMGNVLTNYNDRWTPENPSEDVFYPRLSYGANTNNSQNSTWWLRNMSMLRMKDIEVGYTLPKRWMSRIGLENIRLYAKGSNLLTFSAFDLWDPELDTQNGAKYPIMKSVSFGIDVNF
ncbi:SusC/RagA family TonB-linked outer membrane protein, partial [Parabacteroides merdae]|nr:SusC/RagA family TonB-linked outer membrane protein [Parabacteroides merdae]